MTSQERNGETTTYTYDSLNRLIQVGDNKYSYDNFGNRVKSLVSGIETRYNYNELNQLIRTEGKETTTYEYDRRGNLIKTNNAEYFYDATNRISKAITAKEEVEYVYNGLGNRVKRNNETYTLDLTKPYNNLLSINDSTKSQVQNFIWGNGLISTTNALNPKYPMQKPHNYHYMQDHLGSPIRMVNHREKTNHMASDVDHYFNGATFGYDEFGIPQHEEEYFANPIGFTGYMWDSTAQNYFAQAREYNPHLGRFNAEDIIKGNIFEPFTMNHYSYVWNNPLTLVDLDGLNPLRRPEAEQELIEAAREHGINWLDIANSRTIARDARIRANRRAEADGTGSQGNIHDAYRHFNWMFRTSQIASPSTARFMGDFNEIQGLSGYGGDIISRNDRFIRAYFNDFTLQDLWNNSVAFTLGADRRRDWFPEHRGGARTNPGRIDTNRASRAFQYAYENRLLVNSVSDVERMFGIQFDRTDSNGRPSILGIWDLETNTLRLLGDNMGIIIDLYNDPINGERDY